MKVLQIITVILIIFNILFTLKVQQNQSNLEKHLMEIKLQKSKENSKSQGY